MPCPRPTTSRRRRGVRALSRPSASATRPAAASLAFPASLPATLRLFAGGGGGGGGDALQLPPPAPPPALSRPVASLGRQPASKSACRVCVLLSPPPPPRQMDSPVVPPFTGELPDEKLSFGSVNGAGAFQGGEGVCVDVGRAKLSRRLVFLHNLSMGPTNCRRPNLSSSVIGWRTRRSLFGTLPR